MKYYLTFTIHWLAMTKSILFIAAFLSFVFLSCSIPSADSETSVPAEWNYLIYMAADNNLERFAIDNLIDMKKVGSTAGVNVLVLLDRSPGYDKRYGNWSDTRLLRISRNTDFTSFDHDQVASYGELDMTRLDNLENFLLYAHKNYKAKKTALVLWSHGTGVYPEGVFTDETPFASMTLPRAVIHDYSTGYDYSDAIFIQDLEETLRLVHAQTGTRLDILQFDSCLMQMNEVVWQLAEVVDVFVGSEPDMPGQGPDYEKVLQFITSNDESTAESLAESLVDVYYERYKNSIVGTGYSAFTTKVMWQEYKTSFAAWENALLDAESEEITVLRQAREQMLAYQENYPEYADLFYYLKAMAASQALSESLKTPTQRMIAVLEKSILTNRATNDFDGNLYGLGINFPYTKEQWNLYRENEKTSNLERLKFLQDTRWQEFLARIIEEI